jgi:hypothetical protein
VKPLTTAVVARLGARLGVEEARAALAVLIIFCAARLRTPSGSPSPQTSGGRMDWWRASMLSQMAWPTRWLEMA